MSASSATRAMRAVCVRELSAYFRTPIAYVFLVIFVALTGAFAFYVGGFFTRGRADLEPFFIYHPWLYLFLTPAASMRLWAEERKTGTAELLLSLPLSPAEAAIAKWLAGWIFMGVCLIATAPMWITVNVLGDPDNGAIFAAYLGSFLMAGAFLSVGLFVSTLTSNQVIAFVLAAALCFLLVMSGQRLALDAVAAVAPDTVVAAVESLSALTHFDALARGVVDAGDVFYFVSVIVFGLFSAAVSIERRKAS